jgi:hypothetical protein
MMTHLGSVDAFSIGRKALRLGGVPTLFQLL